ncbi:MAG: glycosyltransferase family 2 protein [Verrucomicrobia bacterium]|nr:glycosyltransferase family 2 protein [Verrucomicrobiota bacterium]MBV9273589.1 glycosyltransferase family 2 protein [Verrucomicrobiota bacterium]
MHGNVGNLGWSFCYSLILFGLSVYGIHRYFILHLYFRHRRWHRQPPSHFSELPVVTVQLPVYNERYVVERLLQSVSRIQYPKEKLEIQVLDDSTDETSQIAAREVERLRSEGFDAVHLRRTERTGFKAGALEAGLHRARGEFFLILDADFVPSPGILLQTIHYFVDPQIGMIQTRWQHLNRSYSWLTRAQAILLDGHLVLEQTARSSTGRFFNFNGTAGLWRRSCIEEAGGWQHDTLTEDLDLSYRAQLKGWRFIFLVDVVTPAELPIEISAFKSQQHRWTKGSIQTCKKLLPKIWAGRLPLWIKAEATIHLTSNFTYLLLALLCILLLPAATAPLGAPSWLRTFLVDIPILVANTVAAAVFYLLAQRELHPERWWRDIIFFPFVLALGIGVSINNARAVLEAVFNYQSSFNRTPKYGIEEGVKRAGRAGYSTFRAVLPFGELLFAVYFAPFVAGAFVHRQFLSLPFLLLFEIGFSYVACRSIWEWSRRLRGEAVSAD